jgi:hypothetical protein
VAAREKPASSLEQLQQMLAAVECVSQAFPDATVSGVLPRGESAVRCAGHVVTQTGRHACGNTVDPKRGSMCEDPRGCRREGRVNGYADA